MYRILVPVQGKILNSLPRQWNGKGRRTPVYKEPRLREITRSLDRYDIEGLYGKTKNQYRERDWVKKTEGKGENY